MVEQMTVIQVHVQILHKIEAHEIQVLLEQELALIQEILLRQEEAEHVVQEVLGEVAALVLQQVVVALKVLVAVALRQVVVVLEVAVVALQQVVVVLEVRNHQVLAVQEEEVDFFQLSIISEQ